MTIRTRSNYNNTPPIPLIHLIRYFTAFIREMINFASTARVPRQAEHVSVSITERAPRVIAEARHNPEHVHVYEPWPWPEGMMHECTGHVCIP